LRYILSARFIGLSRRVNRPALWALGKELRIDLEEHASACLPNSFSIREILSPLKRARSITTNRDPAVKTAGLVTLRVKPRKRGCNQPMSLSPHDAISSCRQEGSS